MMPQMLRITFCKVLEKSLVEQLRKNIGHKFASHRRIETDSEKYRQHCKIFSIRYDEIPKRNFKQNPLNNNVKNDLKYSLRYTQIRKWKMGI